MPSELRESSRRKHLARRKSATATIKRWAVIAKRIFAFLNNLIGPLESLLIRVFGLLYLFHELLKMLR